MANEKRLIDANALMDVIRQHEYPLATRLGSIDNGMFTLGIQQVVDEAPTVDAVEVVHGRWMHHENDIAYCSNCEADAVEDGTNYCPNCGAKMDLEV